MGRIETTFEWCLKQGERDAKHRGLKKTGRSTGNSENQIRKAESDLETMRYLYEGDKTDWVASAAFYAMSASLRWFYWRCRDVSCHIALEETRYHSLSAVLYKLGYESRNQECTISAIEKFMKDRTISLEQEYIDMVRSLQEGIENAKSTREEMQYGSETSMERDRCRRLMDNARKFVDRIKELLEETG